MSLEGKPAPDFTLPAADGAQVTLSALRPRPVVVYFYPRDDTSGCTREALDFTERADAFAAAGAVVLGISKDGLDAHARFRDRHGLGVTLLSDANDSVCETWGVWVEKKMYGRAFMGIERATFLVDGEGIVRREWRKVKVPGHADAVLDAVAAL